MFTTHTPVAAGHDAFELDLMVTHVSQDFIRELGVPVERLLELGQRAARPRLFNMTRLALNGARRMNGVSRIHGAVSARLCADHWPEVPPEENPVGYVTNGVHVPTFLHQTWSRFFDRELGPRVARAAADRGVLACARRRCRDERLLGDRAGRQVAHARGRARAPAARVRAQGPEPGAAAARHALARSRSGPDVLTLGFARRFATYKRATLLLRDRARLARLVNDPERPVLFLFAGKAHPADEPGQAGAARDHAS